MASLRAAPGGPFSPRPACCPPPSSPRSGRGFAFQPLAAPGVPFFPLDSAGGGAGGGVARRRAYPRIEATARHGARKENPKVRNRRLQRKFNGTATKPRLSVFCSNRQLYAMLVDDHNKKILFYGSTLQKAICGDPPCGAVVRHAPPLLHRLHEFHLLIKQTLLICNILSWLVATGGRWEGRGGAHQGVQGAGHHRDLVLRSQRVCSRGEDDGVRGSNLAVRFPAEIAANC
ncbi:hypothetical protein E2562_019450 [Oryza meyeriana var. granulata]|uniref:Uncharacterized protein n=1 Tax=Oryza meyeriana var. granulata TaxID=110450 RepID=A0A6G1DJ62_9ORYZ|nr:hypothetical protein E2562_019450 [Oryza meyeriana var. granulata]